MKILIISYYAFPLNAVPSYRIESFCEGFTKEGADVTLLTRHWDENFKGWEDVLSSKDSPPKVIRENGYRQIFLPYKGKPKDSRFRLISTLVTFKNYLIGNLQPEIDTYSNFREYALNLLQEERDFDLIYVSAPPNNLVRLASCLNKKTNVPFAVDFRDFLNDKYLFKDSNLSLRTKILNSLTLFHVKRWIKNAQLITTVSPRLKSVFESQFNIKTVLALNGYEKKHFSTVQVKPNDIFTIHYIGTAYKGLNFSLIIEDLKKFKYTYPNKRFKIELIGTHDESLELSFQKEFSKDEMKIIKTRIPKEEVVSKVVNSDVLLLVWNVFKDNYGTKIFDYLASGSHVLLSPSDNGIVEKLIYDYENGSVASTSDEVFEVLVNQYDLWERGRNKSKINNYPQFAREKIVVELYKTLKKQIQ